MNSKIKTGIIIASFLFSVSSAFAMDTMMNTSMTGSMMMNNNLMYGSRGSDVVSLQTFLESKGYITVTTKGYFGPLTKAALMKYQADNNLPSTGFFGPMTRGLFNKSITMNTKEDGVMVGGALMVRSKDIVDNAVNANNVTTVVAAVKAAGLVDTLKSAGPFTVFAPTNDAFVKLPAGTVDTLLKPENKAKLVDILTYHVVAGRYTSADLTDGLTLKTVEGKSLTFTKVNGKLMINGSAMVETADVISTNGVTHVIDTVLIPQ